ncbi:MAG: bifunctional [glutamine synthetase] adenylyltransferase/[glutamine synthetase]-adenylyl-L-tyrosine phosphorylase [Acidimicrobiales bacterium]
MESLPASLGAAAGRSADPPAVRVALEGMDGAVVERLAGDPRLADAVVAVTAASHSLSRLLQADPTALDVLSRLDAPPPMPESLGVDQLARWKRLEYLRIAARDVHGLDPVEVVTSTLADLADVVLRWAVELAGAAEVAVIGMGKLGGRELNYASDIDILFVGGDVREARAVMDIARRCFRVDANLRPEGRDGPLTRSAASYAAYWERWAAPWERQALLKARPVAGDHELGKSWEAAAAAAVWDRPFTSDDLRSLRALKARSEATVVGQGVAEREVKRSPGGIRDIEFSVQLLQLVHGRADPVLRSPTTLVALGELAAGGYIADGDADGLTSAYQFLRRVEHALQIEDEQQTHTLPAARDRRRRIARVLGYRGTPSAGPTEAFDRELGRQRNLVRSIHERLYFRPLLDALVEPEGRAGVEAVLSPDSASTALATFGFADVERTRQAVRELTRGLTRSSRMMQQVLPLLLDWLSATPDPDAGLLGLRKLASGEQRATELASAFRETPEIARHLSLLLGTSTLLGDVLAANPDLIVRLADPVLLRTQTQVDLLGSIQRSLSWRDDLDERQRALLRWHRRHLLGVAGRDVFGQADVAAVGNDLTALAEAAVHAALDALAPQVPFTVVALGRFAGQDLAYGSDLDLVFVYDGSVAVDQEEALRVAGGLVRFLAGATPAQCVLPVDTGLRPEGRHGPLARSLSGFATYFDRWAQTWERQAIARARPVAGDTRLSDEFMDLVDLTVWGRPFTADDEREVRRMKARIERERIPPAEDPHFHLKLGRGSLSDVEWTVQLLQLRRGIRAPGAMEALDGLVAAGAVNAGESDVLRAAYRYCGWVRNRWWLVGSAPQHPDSLPQRSDDAARLARSLGTTVGEMRDDYRRVTRRARRVVERLFYGHD